MFYIKLLGQAVKIMAMQAVAKAKGKEVYLVLRDDDTFKLSVE